MSETAVGWEVSVPERASGPVRERRATLRLSSAAGGEEVVRVPVAVGKRLAAAGESAALTRAELLDLVDEVALSCARARIADLLGRRDYTSLEVSGKLAEEGSAPGVAERALAWARSCGLVDDARYGAAFARAKALAGWGRLKVERELARRGVSVDEVDGWPEEFFDPGDELERARALAARRRLTGRNDYEKIARFLYGRGFSRSVALDVAREVAQDRS